MQRVGAVAGSWVSFYEQKCDDDIIDVEDNLETISWRMRKVSIKWSQVTGS